MTPLDSSTGTSRGRGDPHQADAASTGSGPERQRSRLRWRIATGAAALALGVSTVAVLAADPSSAVTRSTVLSATLSAESGATLGSEPVRLLWDGNHGAPVETLATEVTDEDGSVTVNWVPDRADLDRASANGGWFNFTVFVGQGSSTGVTMLPRRWTDGGWATTDPAPGVPARRVPARQPLRLRMQDMTELSATAAGNGARAGHRTTTGTWSRYTRVVNVPSGVDMYTNVAYGSRADSEIGVLVSSGNGWGSAGTSHLANTEAKVGGQVRSRRTYQYKANLRYHEYLQCVVGACWYERRATSWLGGMRATRIRNWRCRHARYRDWYTYPLVTRATKNRGENRTYETGASIGGLDFTAKSGYSRYVDMTIHFRLKGGATRRHYCVGGSTDHWPYAATVYASSR
jgi:hypothetical protein